MTLERINSSPTESPNKQQPPGITRRQLLYVDIGVPKLMALLQAPGRELEQVVDFDRLASTDGAIGCNAGHDRHCSVDM